MNEYCIETYHDDTGWVRRRKFYSLSDLQESDHLKDIAANYARWRIIELIVRIIESHEATHE